MIAGISRFALQADRPYGFAQFGNPDRDWSPNPNSVVWPKHWATPITAHI